LRKQEETDHDADPFRTRIRQRLLAALTASAMPAAAQVDAAQVDGALPTRSISYSDLDLSTVAGQRRLDARIDRAARDMCGADRAAAGSRITSREAMACYRKALASTRERVAAAVARTARGG